MTPFYYDPAVYDLMVDPRQREDIAFWVRQAKPFKEEILELFCGTGQIAQAIRASGKSVAGVDLSRGLIERARRKAAVAKLTVDYRVQDVSRLDFEGRKFGLIFAPMGSMGHLTRQTQMNAFFHSVKKTLLDDGVFALDLPHPDLEYLSRGKNDRFLISRYQDKKQKCEVIVEETGSYDSVRQINHLVWHQSYSDGRRGASHALKLRIFFPEELKMLLDSRGFKVLRRYGTYHGDAFRRTSPRQILFCQKK